MEPRDTVASGRLRQGLGAHHVGLEEPRGIEDRQAVVGLGGEIHDHVDVVLGQCGRHHLEIPDVTPDERDAVLDIVEVRPVPGVGQHVEGDHGVVGVALDPVADEVGADEPGAAGHEESHSGPA